MGVLSAGVAGLQEPPARPADALAESLPSQGVGLEIVELLLELEQALVCRLQLRGEPADAALELRRPRRAGRRRRPADAVQARVERRDAPGEVRDRALQLRLRGAALLDL